MGISGKLFGWIGGLGTNGEIREIKVMDAYYERLLRDKFGVVNRYFPRERQQRWVAPYVDEGDGDNPMQTHRIYDFEGLLSILKLHSAGFQVCVFSVAPRWAVVVEGDSQSQHDFQVSPGKLRGYVKKLSPMCEQPMVQYLGVWILTLK